MSVVTRCGAVSLVLVLLVGVSAASAEGAPGEAAGSSWTDPPARGSAAPEPPAPAKPLEAKPDLQPPAAAEKAPPDGAAQRAAVAPPATPAERAAAKLGVQPVEASQRSASRERRSVVRPRMVERPLVIARRPGRIVERSSRRQVQRSARPAGRSYAYMPPPHLPVRVDPYDGRSYAATWSRRRLAGWGDLVEENRASRIARARDSGYAVMRMRTYAYPDGTRVQRLMPYDGGGFGDLD